MKIIFFSAHTAVWSSALTEATLAAALEKRGHEVVYITSGHQLPECTICLKSYGLSIFSSPRDISKIEQLGILNQTIARKEFGLKGYTLDEVITAQDMKEVDKILLRLNKHNFQDLIIDSINIGKGALYEFLLHHKKMTLDFTEEEWREYLPDVRNALVSLYACRRILAKEKSDRIVIYNTLYSSNNVWEHFASSQNIPVYCLDNGFNLSDLDNTLIITKKYTSYFDSDLKKKWVWYKDLACSASELAYVTNHFLELFRAKHHFVYSTPQQEGFFDIRKQYSIAPQQKILTAVMSSYDELLAAECVGGRPHIADLIFPTQADWIKSLIEYIKDHPELFLIIRVHPREFPDRRVSVKSEHVKMLEKEFQNLPSNVRVNWPSEKISVYNLAPETDVFLSAWSSVGAEMSLLGIPVVIYSKDLLSYTPDINYVAESRSDYFKKVEQALRDGWSFEKIKYAYRWYVLLFCRAIFHFDSMDSKKAELISLPKSFKHKVMRFIYDHLPKGVKFWSKMRFFLTGKGQSADCRSQLTRNIDITKIETLLQESRVTLLEGRLPEQSGISMAEEEKFVRQEMKRLYAALFSVHPEENPSALKSHFEKFINH